MSGKKITLVDVGNYKAGKLASHSELEPLAIEYIGAAAEQAGHTIELIQQRSESLEELLEKILKSRPEVVGFSCYTYKFPEALWLAKKLKSQNEKIITILGGYHATAMPDDIQYGGFDFFVLGEGEGTFIELLDKLDNPKDVKGIAYLENNKVKINPRRERLDFSKLPWPLRKKEFLEDANIKGIVGKRKTAQIMYSRGCPYSCNFCCSPEMWQRTLKFRDPNDVVAEMKDLSKNYGISYFFFADLTFNALTKKVFELTELLKKENFEWCCMPSFDPGNLDEKMIKEWAEAGCKRAMFGVESVSAETSQFLGKRGAFKSKTRADEIYRVFRLCDKYGIGSRAFLMVGNSNEKPEDIKNYLEQLKAILPDEIRIAITTPLPGSQLYKNLDKNLLLYKNFPEDWARFSTNELVTKHQNFTPTEIKTLANWLFDSYYQSEEYGKHLKEKIEKHPSLRKGVEEFVYEWLLKNHGIKVPYF